MRKTKNIILPTKCLNQMGFLLLFLSCPVIGDWGRIRPDTEMSQWSITVEKEGISGLMRDPPGINDEFFQDGPTEHENGAEIRNVTTPTATDSSGRELIFSQGIEARRSRSQSEIRASRERREERSVRTCSHNTIGQDRRVAGKVRDGHRFASETSRRFSRRERNERIRESAGRRVDVRRGIPESISRNENMSYRRVAREERSRRVEDRIDQTIRNDRREMDRQDRRDSRTILREEREERKPEGRRSREVIQNRRFVYSERKDNEDGRRRSERRISNQRDRTEERLSIDNRRQDRKTEKRNERSVESRRNDFDRSRRQNGFRRLEKSHREYNIERESLDRFNREGLIISKQKKTEENRFGEFFSGIKNWFKHKTADNTRIGSHGDFATTCLVGAAAYFLTTRHGKVN